MQEVIREMLVGVSVLLDVTFWLPPRPLVCVDQRQIVLENEFVREPRHRLPHAAKELLGPYRDAPLPPPPYFDL
jgi:hypothetical protein